MKDATKLIVDKIKNLKPTQKLMLAVAAMLAACLLIYLIAIAPLLKKISTLNKQITVQEARFIKTFKLVGSKDVIEAEYAKVKSYFSLQGSDEKVISTLLREIESCASKARVSLLQVSPEGKPEEKDAYKAYGVNIVLEAPMEDLLGFLYQLEHSPVLFDITRINITPRDKLNIVLKIKLKVQGITLL